MKYPLYWIRSISQMFQGGHTATQNRTRKNTRRSHILRVQNTHWITAHVMLAWSGMALHATLSAYAAPCPAWTCGRGVACAAAHQTCVSCLSLRFPSTTPLAWLISTLLHLNWLSHSKRQAPYIIQLYFILTLYKFIEKVINVSCFSKLKYI